ncbi:MAG: Gfo/Idh/MocA family oxidoreductase [Candidatus Latescibacteria bacterium]|nr:Gfo/Idh/MocA family oxidoreductase [Candidatus Latescibacterota bacterium]
MNLALIGCGQMGRGHARAAHDLGFPVVAFCDLHREAATQARDEYGCGYVTTDPGRILRDEEIDLVIIATHHDAHHPLALAAAQAGKHILLEKPMCLTVSQAVEVAEAVDKAGVKMAINCKFRIAPTVQKAKHLIPHPRISHGQLAMGDSSQGRSAWIWDKDDGGGLLISTAVHTVDLLSYLMGCKAEQVYAEGRLFGTAKTTMETSDALAGTIRWDNGGVSTLISTDQGFNPMVSKWFHEIWDGERSAVFSAHTSRVDFGGCEIAYLDVRELPEDEQRRASMLLNLIDAIREETRPLCDQWEGVQTVAICNALEAAARTGRPQRVWR